MNIAQVSRFGGSVTFLIVAVIAYIEAGDVERLGFDPLGAAYFPRLIALAIGALALAKLLQEIISPVHGVTADQSRTRLLQAVCAIVVFVLFALTVRNGWLAFPLSGMIFCTATGLLYMQHLGARSLGLLALLSIALPLALDYIFSTIFYVSMP